MLKPVAQFIRYAELRTSGDESRSDLFNMRDLHAGCAITKPHAFDRHLQDATDEVGFDGKYAARTSAPHSAGPATRWRPTFPVAPTTSINGTRSRPLSSPRSFRRRRRTAEPARSAISTRPRAGSGRGRRPLPARNRADRMQIGVGLGPRVLLGDACTELDVRADRLPEAVVVGQAGLVERLHVQSDEAIALLVGDLQLAVDVDDVLKAELAREAVGAAERLGGEPGQVVDMGRDALGKEHLHDRVRERLVVEDLLEAVQRLVSARVFVQTLHSRHTSEQAR